MAMDLIIKGNKKNATRAASRRGITLRKCRVAGTGGRLKGTIACEAPCSQFNRIHKWYGEKSGLKKGRGHVPGTLLYFDDDCHLKGRR